MNYEEKYKEALERAKKYKLKEDLIITQDIFPELAESEDEKIRKEIISIVKSYRESCITEGNHRFDDCLVWLEKQCDPQDKGEISDGYHTFNELYYYRMLYNAAFFNMLPKEWVHKSKRHNDGEECFGGGWFIVMANLPTGQISNHYELKDWDLFQIPEKEVADKWDGHTPQEAADRLHKYLLEKQSEQSQWKPTEEQLQTIHAQLNEGAVTYPDDKRVLTTLYEDLMKITTQAEKQGEQKETPCGRCRKEQPSHSCQDITELGRCALEHEQQPADRVEPKFKVEEGKWYICTQTFVLRGKIVVIKGQVYQARENGAIKGEEGCLFVDKHDGKASEYFRLWTIADAKEGDVLICGNQTFLFKCIEEKQVYCYGYIWRNEYKEMIGFQFCNQPNQLYCYTDAVMSPATKEQRDTLFTKMKEAGYEWDADKKELKKIEQKPTKRSLPYEKNETVEKLIALAECLEMDGDCLFNGLSGDDYGKLLRVLAIELTEVKPAWSEEDDKILNTIINDIQERHPKAMWKINYGNTVAVSTKYIIDWLKSLKDRI